MTRVHATALRAALLMSVAAVAAVTSASAAPAPAWTGFYVGLSAGYGDHSARYEDPDYDWYGATIQFRPDGGVYGVQGGHNWQNSNVAFGIEGDILISDIGRDQIYDAQVLAINEVDWLASLRARKGFAFGDTFIYHTLGLALGEFERSWTELDDVSDSWPDLGDTKVGVVAGFGIERAIGGAWSVRTEARAMRFFDNTTYNEDGFPLTIDDTILLLKAGVNYSFGERRGSGGGLVVGTPYDFSGFFVGGSLGGHMATAQLTDIDYDWYGSTYDLLSNGIVAGVQGGWNNQINGFVYGVEANVNFYGGDDTARDDFNSGPDTMLDATIDSGLNWGGNLKFKAGAAADNTMMYLIAGYAFVDYDLQRVDFDSGGDVWDLAGTRSGFVVGTGIEHAFTPNVTGRIEAAFSGIGGDTVNSLTDSSFFRGAARDVTIMAGVNYYLEGRGMGTGALAPADWAGFYAGADALFAYHQGTIWDRNYDDHGGFYTLPTFGGGAGVHAGYDWQDDTFVYGLIGDIAFFSNDESDTSPGYRTVSSSLNWMGTVRGRAGVATGQALFYATGGFAFGDADLDYDYLPAPDPDSFHFDSARTGWTIGLGVEKMMSDRSSFTFETRFTRFGEEEAFDGDICTDEVTEACAMIGYDDTITVKVGYSLRWGAFP